MFYSSSFYSDHGRNKDYKNFFVNFPLVRSLYRSIFWSLEQNLSSKLTSKHFEIFVFSMIWMETWLFNFKSPEKGFWTKKIFEKFLLCINTEVITISSFFNVSLRSSFIQTYNTGMYFLIHINSMDFLRTNTPFLVHIFFWIPLCLWHQTYNNILRIFVV